MRYHCTINYFCCVMFFFKNGLQLTGNMRAQRHLQFRIKIIFPMLGVNFANVLWATFERTDQKITKRLTIFCRFWDLRAWKLCVKMLVKLTLDLKMEKQFEYFGRDWSLRGNVHFKFKIKYAEKSTHEEKQNLISNFKKMSRKNLENILIDYLVLNVKYWRDKCTNILSNVLCCNIFDVSQSIFVHYQLTFLNQLIL